MSFEDEHGKGALAEALTMATFEGVKPKASDDDDSAITFVWEDIGEWRFGYILPNFVFYKLVMYQEHLGFILWAVTEKLQEVIDRFSPDGSLIVRAEQVLPSWLSDQLIGMGFEREGDSTDYVGNPSRIQEWGSWVKAGAKDADEPEWRKSLREAGLFDTISYEPTPPTPPESGGLNG